ncbi:DUF402 domain-containing protein [Haloparvum sedimenti]|uniref:DUF402 domain-containing protein n=1 Tax=Haloparvum sedimenti TaxID=1678448 RepID=UPI00071E7F3D|nr:DUF402 domain-containing protein [Haloparvum sedimenti]
MSEEEDGGALGTPPVRVRGIYATALTRLLADAGHDVADASPPIRRRFADSSLADRVQEGGAPAAEVVTTDDRQGVGVAGGSAAVEAVTDRLRGVARDALAWTDPAPSGSVFDGEVTETLGGGAVVDLGSPPGAEGSGATVEGYLPYGNVDDRVEVGDAVRVQVRETAAPWDDDRPVLDAEIRVVGELASLVPGGGTRVESYDEAAGRELAGMADLLDLHPPDDWGIVWHAPAVDAGMDALREALDSAVDRAEAVEAATDDPVGEPGRLVAPRAGAWVWFGRESRFALDRERGAVAPTMLGHHRIKAGSASARAGVDFAEALTEPMPGEDPEAAFPFDVVTEQFGPHEGDAVRIEHGKPAGHRIVLGEGTVTEVEPDGSVSVRREMTPGGSYDELDARREAGDTAHTSFKEGRWWYPTVYRDAEGATKGTYVNVCTPVEAFPDAIRYVDLHVDVVKAADGTVRRVDDDELDAAVAAGDVPTELAEKARAVASALENAL